MNGLLPTVVVALAACALLPYSCRAVGPAMPTMPTEELRSTSGCTLIQRDQLPTLVAETYRSGDSSAAPSVSVERMSVLCTAQDAAKGRYRSVSVLVNYTCDGSGACPDGAVVSQFDFSCDDDSGGWEALALSTTTDGVRTDDPQSNFSTSAKTGCSYCASQEAIEAAGLSDSSSDVLTHCVGELTPKIRGLFFY